MKYIIFDNDDFVIFPETMNHREVAFAHRAVEESVSGAGFIRIGCGDHNDFEVFARCYGESISLGIKSRGNEDETIIERYLNQL